MWQSIVSFNVVSTMKIKNCYRLLICICKKTIEILLIIIEPESLKVDNVLVRNNGRTKMSKCCDRFKDIEYIKYKYKIFDKYIH